MDKLTETQKKAFEQLKKNGPSTSYEVGYSLSTMNALVKKGFASKTLTIGYIAFPRSAIIFTPIEQP